MSSKSQHTITRKAVGSGDLVRSPEPPMAWEDENDYVPGRSGGIYWKAYTVMITSLLCGMLLALGHHLFYKSLNGKPVEASQHIIHGVTRQQFNLTIGTLFAFLIKAFLAVAVTSAYTQFVWRAIKKRPTRLTTINTVFHVLTDFWSLLRISVWWRYPLLLLLASII